MKPRRDSRLEQVVKDACLRAREANPLCGFSVLFGAELMGFFLSEVANVVMNTGTPLKLPGFGTFYRRETRERTTVFKGAVCKVPAQQVLAFRAAGKRKRKGKDREGKEHFP